MAHFVDVPPHVACPFEIRSPDYRVRSLVSEQKLSLGMGEADNGSVGNLGEIENCLSFTQEVFVKDVPDLMAGLLDVRFFVIGPPVECEQIQLDQFIIGRPLSDAEDLLHGFHFKALITELWRVQLSTAKPKHLEHAFKLGLAPQERTLIWVVHGRV